MPKTDAQRITDTLNYLQNTNIVGQAARAVAHQLAQDYVTAAFPNAQSPGYHQLSQSLSLGFHLMNDPNERRRMKRALFLLWKAMNHLDVAFTMPFPNIAPISQATVQRDLTDYIHKARCLYEEHHGGNLGATHVLTQMFQANPLQFLRHNEVFVLGSTALDHHQAPQNVRPCSFRYNAYHDRYEFGVGQVGGNGAANVQVESVTAFHWTDQRYVPQPGGPPPPPPLDINTTNFGQMTGIQLSGAHLMVTTMFTGCAFSMAEFGNHMYCAHVSPAGVPGMAPDTTGNTLAQRVIATGAFTNAGGTAVRVYGRNLGSVPNQQGYDIGPIGTPDSYMNIVGFPGGATYHIFAQTVRNNGIAEVRQIF